MKKCLKRDIKFRLHGYIQVTTATAFWTHFAGFLRQVGNQDIFSLKSTSLNDVWKMSSHPIFLYYSSPSCEGAGP